VAQFQIVLVTCGSRNEATKIARALVDGRLAACVNILSARVESIYHWKGRTERAKEFLLVIKTTRRRVAALRREVERLHSYEVPEIIALPIVAGSPKYLRWIEESVERLDPSLRSG
jgi:periplasmic divalent cation tolerance protein